MTEDRNCDSAGAIPVTARVAVVFEATEDRNTFTFTDNATSAYGGGRSPERPRVAISLSGLGWRKPEPWRLSFGVAEDRDTITWSGQTTASIVAFVLGGDRGSQLNRSDVRA